MPQKNKVAPPTTLLVNRALQEAEDLLKQGKQSKGLEVLEKINDFLLNGKQDIEVIRANVLHKMADLYLNTSNVQKAISYNQEALEIQTNLLGETAKATLDSRLLKGVIGERLGRFKTNLDYLLETLALYDTTAFTDSEGYAILHWTIGSCYHHLQDTWQSRLYYQKAIQVFEGLNTPDQSWKPLLYNSIGRSYAQAKESEQALQYYQKALTEFIEWVGNNHPHTSMVYTNIGIEYYEMSKYQEALFYFQKSLDILEHLSGNYSAHLADIYIAYGASYIFLADFENAHFYLQKGLKISLELYDKSHSKIINAYHAIALMYEHKGSYRQALEVCQKGLIGAVAFFKEEDFYQNPDLIDIPIDNLCIPLLNRKASVFAEMYLQQEAASKYLKAALEAIDLAIRATERTYFYTDYSKLTSYRFYNRNYATSIKIRHLIWERNKNFTALEKAFSAIEKTKGYLLRMAMQGALSNANSFIPTSLLQEKQELENKMVGLNKQLQMRKSEQEANTLEGKVIQSLQGNILDNLQEYNQLVDQLKKDFPEYLTSLSAQLRYKKKFFQKLRNL